MLSEFEPVDELGIIGYLEEPDVASIFETNGKFFKQRKSPYYTMSHA